MNTLDRRKSVERSMLFDFPEEQNEHFTACLLLNVIIIINSFFIFCSLHFLVTFLSFENRDKFNIRYVGVFYKKQNIKKDFIAYLGKTFLSPFLTDIKDLGRDLERFRSNLLKLSLCPNLTRLPLP